MGKTTEGFERIPELMALMMADKYIDDSSREPTLTVKQLSEITGFPVTLLQRDLVQLFSNECINDALVICEEDNIDKTDWIKQLRAGEKSSCDVRFCVQKDSFWEYDEGEACFVNLSPFEKNVFAKVRQCKGISDAVWIKETWTDDNRRLEKLKDRLQAAIVSGYPVTFTYYYNGEESVYQNYSPARVYETMENRQLYLVGYTEDGKEDIKRLDCISNVIEQKEDADLYNRGLPEFLDYIWEADAGFKERVNVKIKIFNNTKNIIPKIEAVVSGRKYAKLYPEPDNDKVWYYEDTIMGMNSFKRWLRSFGASVVALEPLQLAEDMYQSAVRRLAKYEEM